MNISTSLNLYTSIGQSFEEKIIRAKKCGFRYLDFNITDYYGYKDSLYTQSNWKDWLKSVKEFADKEQVIFYQSHGLMYEAFKTDRYSNCLDEALRSIEAAKIMDVKWVVFHPVDYGPPKEFLKNNYEQLSPIVDYAEKLNIGIAIENIPRKLSNIYHEYGYKSDHLKEIKESLGGKVGFCWDTGHANLTSKEQKNEILKLGKDLKVLHIADNFGYSDDHMPPFYGDADWKDIMTGLRGLNYDGTFNFETHNFTKGLPDELIDYAVSYLFKIGEYITINY